MGRVMQNVTGIVAGVALFAITLLLWDIGGRRLVELVPMDNWLAVGTVVVADTYTTEEGRVEDTPLSVIVYHDFAEAEAETTMTLRRKDGTFVKNCTHKQKGKFTVGTDIVEQGLFSDIFVDPECRPRVGEHIVEIGLRIVRKGESRYVARSSNVFRIRPAKDG